MSAHNILVGCDPEIFVKKDGTFVSAHGLIQGDKKNPLPVPNGAVQVDGMALEFNINPATDESQFVTNVTSVMQTLAAMVPGYELAPVPVAHFTHEYIAQQPPAAVELGCDPDYNAYTGEANVKPDANRPMRTASGHVHIGWDNGQDIYDPDHIARCHAAVKQCDVMLGIASLFYDTDTERRSMYGQGGCLRYKSYGVEYRTLSNAWLLTPERMAWVFRTTKKAMDRLFDGEALFVEARKMGFDIPAIINSSDRAQAEKVIQAFNLEIVK